MSHVIFSFAFMVNIFNVSANQSFSTHSKFCNYAVEFLLAD